MSGEHSQHQTTTVAIVGGGPIGLELAAALREHAIAAEVFEAGTIGHSISWWAPGTRFFSSPERISIAGVPLITPNQDKASREQYLDYLRQVAGAAGVSVRQHTLVTDIRRTDSGPFELDTRPSDHGFGGPGGEPDDHARSTGPTTTWRADAVVLAIGDMHRPRPLGVPGEDLPFVTHYMVDPRTLYDRDVLIVGGKNSACEAAIRLYRAKARVTISYRRPEFDDERVKPWVLPELKWLIDHDRVRWFPATVPERIERGSTTLVGVDDSLAPTAVRNTVDTDHVLALTGYEQDQTLFQRLGVEMITTEHRPKHDRRTMQTNVPGVYVAGTAVGGLQTRARVFIENSHAHVLRIAAALTGGPEPHIGNAEGVLPEASLPES